MNFEQAIGWIGTVLISSAAIPQTLKVWKQGHADGLAWSYLLLLWAGFLCMFIYTPVTRPALVVSYSIQLVLFAVMIFRKKYPNVH